MSVHDTIGDFITVIRNAGSAGKSSCSYPHSKLRVGIAGILKKRGFVEDFSESEEDGQKKLEIRLKYAENGKHAIKGCLLYTSPSPRDQRGSRMPSSA